MVEFEGGVEAGVIDGLQGAVRQAQAVAARKMRDEREKKGGGSNGGGKFGGRGGRGQRGAMRRGRDEADLGDE